MGMSAEDFGAVLGELPAQVTWADKLEALDPQKPRSRWWFSIKTHVTSHFEACEYHDWQKRGQKGPSKQAKDVWQDIKRPEMIFWVACALGLVSHEQGEKVFNELLALDDPDSRTRLSARCKFLRKEFPWSTVESAALEMHAKLAAASALGHRSA